MTTTDFTPDFSRSAFPETDRAKEALSARDWATVRALFNRGHTWRDRSIFIGITTGIEGVEDFLRQVVADDPGDSFAGTLLANHLVRVGWDIRSGQRAKYVSSEQFDAFHAYLRQAEQLLIEVCARDPAFVPAWSQRINIARGLELGQAEGRRRYDRLAAVEPNYQPAQQALLQNLCPKWSGDFATMHAFASACADTAPPGSPNPALVVEGHVEHWLDLKGEDASAYFRDEGVRQQIRAAAEKSVFDPAFDHRPGWVYALSMFALGFSMFGDWKPAKRCFIDLGPYADSWGWQYLKGGATEAFKRWRAQAVERG